MRREDFDVWWDKFQPITKDNTEFLWETYGDDVEHVWKQEACYVWTVIDCNGKLYLSPGKRIVDRLNYVICKNPWNEKTRDYFYG